MLACLYAALATVPSANAASIAAPAVTAGPDAGAATPDPSAIVYNPAAIGSLDGVHLLLDAQAAFIHVNATATRNDGIDPETGAPYEPIDANVMVPVAVLGATWKVVPKYLALGFAVNDPFVGGGKYLDENGDPDMTSHGRYHGVSVEIITLAATPSVAVTPIDGLHVGGGFSYVFDHIAALQAADPLGTEGVAPEQIGQSPPDDPYAYDVILDANASGHHFAWNAGLFFDKFEKLQVGLSYASGATFSASGDAAVTVPAALSTTAEEVTIPGKAAFTLYLPPIARVALASQINEKLRVGAELDYEMWNVCCGTADGDVHIQVTNENGVAIGPDDGVTIPIAEDQYNPSRLWNAASISGNGGYQITDPLWAGLRVQYNQYATPSYSVTPVNLDFENVGVQVGARYRLGESLTLGLSYSHFFLFTRTVTDSAWNLQDGNDRFSPSLPSTTSGNGVYSGTANTVGLRVAADF